MSKTRKKRPTPKKAVKKTVAKVKRAAKPAKRAAKKATRKPVKRRATAKLTSSARSASSAANHVTNSALKLVDQAASLLRTGIRTSSSQTVQAHLNTKKRVLALVDKASDHLTKAVKQGSGNLRNILGRL
ncbi:MAG: hypothetical protein ABI443_05960 [Chthoniobacterales bacterium]